jgi:hypothetical protein
VHQDRRDRWVSEAGEIRWLPRFKLPLTPAMAERRRREHESIGWVGRRLADDN